MGASSSQTSSTPPPRVVAATLVVIGLPLAAVSLLGASGVIASFLPLAAMGTALSLAASYAGAAIWARRTGSGEPLFGELLVWGWLRQRRQERQLDGAISLLGLRGAAGEEAHGADLDPQRRIRLLKRLANSLESRSPDTYGHSRRVARHAAATAKRMGLPREEVARIRAAAAVHDVGKVEVPAEILEKPGALSEEEFAAVKRHAAAGAEMVAPVGDEELTAIVRHHHERLDGRGYPDGLAGEEIPLGARILAVADTFDAVTSTRPYRETKTHREALALLDAEAGTQLDADAVEAFRRHYSGLRPVALWALALSGPRHLIVSLTGSAKLAGGVTAAALATVAAAGVTVPDRRAEDGAASRPSISSQPAASRAASSVGEGAAGRRAGRRQTGGDRGSGGDGVGAAPPAGGEGVAVDAEGPRGGDGPRRSTRGGSGSGRNGGSGGGGSSGDRGDEPRRAQPVEDAVDTVGGTVDSTVDRAGDTVDTVEGTVGSAREEVIDPVVDGVESELPEVDGDGLVGG